MSAYTEQEEIEKLKEWFKNYGGALLIGVAIGLGLLFGGKYWTRYQEHQRETASALYAQMLDQAQKSKADLARANGDKLMKDYTRTPYAGMAALMLARLNVQAHDQAGARKNLQWAVDHATDPAVKDAARLRLGQLEIAAHDYQAAAKLAQAAAPGFEAEYLELKGDAYAGLGKFQQARAAYEEALKNLPPNARSRPLIQMKLDDVSGRGAG